MRSKALWLGGLGCVLVFGACSKHEFTNADDDGGGEPNGGGGTGSDSDSSIAGASAGGSAVPSGGMGGESSAPAAVVVSTLPLPGADSVLSDATIRIEFGDTMDVASVLAGYTSTDLPKVAVTFEWSEGNTVLTITPKDPLTYGTPSAGKYYQVQLDSTVRTAQGGTLEDAWTLGFEMARLRSVEYAPVADISSSGYWRETTQGSCGSYDICFGDSSTDLQYKGFLTFSLDLPSDVISVVDGTLVLGCTSVAGTPFAGLGTLSVEHVTFSAVGTAAFGQAALSVPWQTTTSASSYQVDVTDAVSDDVENGEAGSTKSQFRMAFSTATDSDSGSDVCLSALADNQLVVEFLTP